LTYDKYTRGLLAALLGLSLAACQGEAGPAGAAGQDGQDGQDGADGDVGPIGPQGPGAVVPPGDGLKIEIQSTTIATDGTIVVTFKATDAAGKAIDAVAERVAKATTGFEPRFTLAVVNAQGASQSIYLGATGPSSDRNGALAATATPGVFTYTFEKKIPVTDAALTHTVGVWAYRYDANKLRYPSSDTFAFVPGGGTPVSREIVSDAACNACHGTLTLHGSRQTVALCTTCHTSQLAAGEANMSYMAHKIHAGEHLANGFELGGHEYSEVTFPQALQNCVACHQGADAAKYKVASAAACGSCHDSVNFTTGVGHSSYNIEVTAEMKCTDCHSATKVEKYHEPVIQPDPTSTFAGGTNTRTNAAYVAAAGYVPAGAEVITYDVKSVSVDADRHPVAVFKLKKNGTDVVFQTFAAGVTTELIPNFVGTPVVYFAWAVPQDGIAKPADFNVTANVAVKRVWNAAVTTSSLAGPDAEGYYTMTINNAIVPTDASMLTGGLGYAYDLPNNQPLTQTNLAAFPYATNGTGGLIVPTPDKVVVGTGFTGHRAIVDNAKCNACHGFLGVAPSFHVGQRNDGATCSFCHTPNKATGSEPLGWSANAKDFVHAVHGAGKREENFTWHQLSDTEGFWKVTYPRELNDCGACHVAGSFDFSAAGSKAALPNLLASTVATGTIAVGAKHSPYVAEGVLYGAGFSYATATGVTTPAAGTTLVVTPITAACSACHDSPMAVAHMEQNGGGFYAPRNAVETETCMVCHGPGKVAPIAEMHK
jgi:OmcA/MtrC family decaheme c-type cytochrome